MSLYVVEINVPTAGFMPIGDREEMESPAYFGTRRGYWRVYMGQDEVGNERPDGVQAILELDAGSAEEAEDLAEAAGRKLSAFFATYLGSPLTTPRISKLAEIGASGGIVEQRSYHYEAPKSGWPQVKITPPDLTNLIRRVSGSPPEIQNALNLAMRWYGMSVGAEDPFDSYLAVWVGLEALGPLFNKRVHPPGSSQICGICGYKRKTSTRGDAGLCHLIKQVAPEVLVSRRFQDLKEIRNKIVHGVKVVGQPAEVDALRELAAALFPDLMICLAKGILTIASPPEAEPGGLNSALPRDYETHPAALVWVRFSEELLSFKPWFDEWIAINYVLKDHTSWIEETGQYVCGYRPAYSFSETIDQPNIELTSGLVLFDRRGVGGSFHGDPTPVQREWREKGLSPALRRTIEGSVG